jgi:uncharacterized protein (TIGR02172 family)
MNLGKCIGVGNTASIYEWEDGKVLKLFHQGYPGQAVENEYHNAMAIRDMNFAKPKAYEVISYEDRKGIIYDRVDGEPLLDWVMRNGDLQQCAIYMAELHKAMLHNEINNVAYYKDFLKYHMSNAFLSSDEKDKLLQLIDKLPGGTTLCHGDFHPGNIIISEGCTYVIDFMNICHGNDLYDIARTVYLVEYTPVPAKAKDRDLIIYFKKTLSDLYLLQMNVTREMIQDYLTVITVVRKGECPNEF